ncbi:hypothetical protein L227DRAFT_94190 [Lentinus tigrinus ALCF2SS1-6]|uniref:Uncharacterized protein n=1 Tax=Lentinus tigrinus ALCF2SS1-6 TaxID=1328759 RepID=A0A5C2SBK5_9APHY|nr:hypothetical protein L227DRAFT_94190 [Lentinus tigrinus ALCF2SS1-6]
MDAYLTTPINPRALLGPSAVQSTTNTSSGRLTIYDLLSAYCYAKYPIPPIMSAVLNLHVDDGLELSVAALVFHYPELLPSTSGDSAALHRSTTVLHWLNVCIPQPDVDSAWIEELDQEQGRLVVVYGPEPPPGTCFAHTVWCYVQTSNLLIPQQP